MLPFTSMCGYLTDISSGGVVRQPLPFPVSLTFFLACSVQGPYPYPRPTPPHPTPLHLPWHWGSLHNVYVKEYGPYDQYVGVHRGGKG